MTLSYPTSNNIGFRENSMKTFTELKTQLEQQKADSASIAQQGFTLIELMIVIAIIGILAAIAIPQYDSYVRSAEATTIAQDFHQAITAVTADEAQAQAGVATTASSMPYATTTTVADGATIADSAGKTGIPATGNKTSVTITLNKPTSTSVQTDLDTMLQTQNPSVPAGTFTDGAAIATITPNGKVSIAAG